MFVTVEKMAAAVSVTRFTFSSIILGAGRRPPLIRPRCIGLVGLMAADRAAGNRANRTMMSREVTGNAANDRAFDAALRLGGAGKRDAQGGDADDDGLHDEFLEMSRHNNSPWRFWFHCQNHSVESVS
jgi:hypothetical protein